MNKLKIAKQHYNSNVFGYNYIINGNFDIWQRRQNQITPGYGSDDRWNNFHIGTTKVHSKQAFAVGEVFPNGEICPKYYSRTVVNSVVGAGNYCLKHHGIKSVYTLAGKKAILSFWARANANKNMSIELMQGFGSGGSPSSSIYLSPTKIALTTTWQKFNILIDFPVITGKILGTNNNDQLSLNFWFDGGSTWNSRTNSLGHQSGTFDIACVSLVEGTEDNITPIPRTPAEELFLCQETLEIIPFTLLRQLTSANLGGTGQVCYNFLAVKPFVPTVEVYTDPTLATPGYDFYYTSIKDISTLTLYVTTTDLRVMNNTGLPNVEDFGTGVLVISAEI